MSKLELIRALYDYNEWANSKLLSTCETLAPEQFSQSTGGSWGSIETNLAHIVAAQVNWLTRWRSGRNREATTRLQAMTGLDNIRQAFEASHADLRGFTASLSDDDLDRVLAYADSRGNAYEHVLWQLMTHVANHGTYHRGEVAAALTAFGRSPGDLDYVYFEMARGAEADDGG